MMNVDAKITLEGVFSVIESLSPFGAEGTPRSRIDENAWTLNLFGLVRMQNGNLIELTVQRSGLLTRH